MIPMKKIAPNKKRLESILCLLSLISVLGFFMVMVGFMTMSGEDILHQNWVNDIGMTAALDGVYHHAPRIGEFFQRTMIQFFDYQTEFNLNIIWRVFDVALCFGAVFVLAMLGFGRRLRLQYKDTICLLVTFTLLVTAQYNEVFMMRFSYLHNYVPALIFAAWLAYACFFPGQEKKSAVQNILSIAGIFIIGLLFGASTEIAPIAFSLLIVGNIVYRKIRAKQPLSELVRTSKHWLAALAGTAAGFLTMFSSGALLSRGESAYGIKYDYIHFSDLFNGEFLHSIFQLSKHLLTNTRGFFIPILIMLVIIVVEWKLRKRTKTKPDKQMFIQVNFLLFVIVYILGTIQIDVLSDLYPRFMAPAYLAVIASITMFITHLITLLKPEKFILGIFTVGLLAVTLVICLDMTQSFRSNYIAYGNELNRIKNSPTKNVCVESATADSLDSRKSRLFNFTQYPPLEAWAVNMHGGEVPKYGTIYGKGIYYTSPCTQIESSPTNIQW
jgi:hypothetical protein